MTVEFIPNSPDPVPPLASPDDISMRLGRELTDSEKMRINSLLRDASAQIRRYCRKSFLYEEDDQTEIQADGAILVLPGDPVWSVSKVELRPPRPHFPWVVIPWWRFDGIREVRVGLPRQSGVINYPEWMMEDFWFYGATYRVTYTHGPREVPEEIVMVAANSVIAVLTAPTQAAGVIGETLGAYSYRLERSGGGLAVTIQPQDLAVLNDFRSKQMTMKLDML